MNKCFVLLLYWCTVNFKYLLGETVLNKEFIKYGKQGNLMVEKFNNPEYIDLTCTIHLKDSSTFSIRWFHNLPEQFKQLVDDVERKEPNVKSIRVSRPLIPINDKIDDKVYCLVSLNGVDGKSQDLCYSYKIFHQKMNEKQEDLSDCPHQNSPSSVTSTPTTTDPNTAYTTVTEKDVFKNVTFSIEPPLKDLIEPLRIDDTSSVYKFYKGKKVNLECVVKNVPNGSYLKWIHYKNYNVNYGKRECKNEQGCKTVRLTYKGPFDKSFPKKNNNTVAECVLEKNLTVDFSKQVKTINITLIRVLLVHPSKNYNPSRSRQVIAASTLAPPSAGIVPNSTTLTASLTVLGILILLLILFLIYYFKFRGKPNTTTPLSNNQDAIYAVPHATYANLSLPEPRNQNLNRSSVLYSEVTTPSTQYANLSKLEPGNQPPETEMPLYSQVVKVKKPMKIEEQNDLYCNVNSY